jgi:hypothetical protein
MYLQMDVIDNISRYLQFLADADAEGCQLEF